MSSPPRRIHPTARAWLAIIGVEIALIFSLVGVAFWSYSQSQTESQICQLVGFVGSQTQLSIKANSALLTKDLQHPTNIADAADATARRHISDTTLLDHVNAVRC